MKKSIIVLFIWSLLGSIFSLFAINRGFSSFRVVYCFLWLSLLLSTFGCYKNNLTSWAYALIFSIFCFAGWLPSAAKYSFAILFGNGVNYDSPASGLIFWLYNLFFAFPPALIFLFISLNLDDFLYKVFKIKNPEDFQARTSIFKEKRLKKITKILFFGISILIFLPFIIPQRNPFRSEHLSERESTMIDLYMQQMMYFENNGKYFSFDPSGYKVGCEDKNQYKLKNCSKLAYQYSIKVSDDGQDYLITANAAPHPGDRNLICRKSKSNDQWTMDKNLQIKHTINGLGVCGYNGDENN